jgi:hypothetical protein
MYVKVFPSMYDGTLATHGPWQALVTFQQLLVLADPEGAVDMTPEAIARRTTIPMDIITVGIVALEQPDPESRSPALDGRRIVRLSESRSWGWQIVNYSSYRAMRDEANRREYFRQYQRKRRAAQAVNSDVNNVHTLLSDVTKVNPSSKQKQKQKQKDATSIPKGFSISDRVRRWAAEKSHDRLEARFEHFVGYVRAHGKTYVDWDDALMNAIRDNWAKLEPPSGYVPRKKQVVI